MSLPPAPVGTFRLFRLLSLYPVPRIQLKTFPYPGTSSFRGHGAAHDHSTQGQTCSISEIPSSPRSCPPYSAISYAWTPNIDANTDKDPFTDLPAVPAATEPVFVVLDPASSQPALTILVTTHLLYGLLTVQERCEPTWLFVDAICIDQGDPHDKAVQVHGMDRVFAGADRVLVWLGMDLTSEMKMKDSPVGTEDSDMSIGACLDQIPELVENLEIYLNSCGDSRKDEGNTDLVARTAAAASLPPAYSPLWPALQRLRLNSWFARLWVVQEVTLSHNTILLYGRHSLPWSTYTRLTSLCESVMSESYVSQHGPSLTTQLHLAYNNRVSAMANLQKQWQIQRALTSIDEQEGNDSEGESATLLCSLIDVICKSRTSIPLDRVYAVRGLLGEKIREHIPVEYTDDNMCRYWIQWAKLVQTVLFFIPKTAEEIFSIATSLEHHPGLPSWCPNLADNGEIHSIAGTSITCAGMPKGQEWKAEPRLCTTVVIPGTLHVRLLGLKLDTVAQVIDLSWIEEKLRWAGTFVDRAKDIDSDLAQEILVTLWKCLSSMKTTIPEGDTVLARCLVANEYNHQEPDSSKLLEEYIAFTHYLEYHTWGPSSSGVFSEATKSAAFRFGERFRYMSQKRAFFVTTDGHAGLCSSKAKDGDSLCVFMNYRLPWLLRNQVDGGMYELVSETYVDGIMHGEAFIGRSKIKKRPQEFIVC